jgi:hypothetical protein
MQYFFVKAVIVPHQFLLGLFSILVIQSHSLVFLVLAIQILFFLVQFQNYAFLLAQIFNSLAQPAAKRL